MISPGALFIALFAAAIPASWFFFVRWFLSKDVAETELLDQFEAAELTDTQKSDKSAIRAKQVDSDMPDLTHAGAH